MVLRKAFTVLELLVVIGIIAIIMGIVYVLLAGTREQGKQTTCISNLRQIGQAISMYRADYGDREMSNSKAMNVLQALGAPFVPGNLISSGLATKQLFICPDDESQANWKGTGLKASYSWCAAGVDRDIPGTGIRRGDSWLRYKDRHEAIVVAADEHHFKRIYNIRQMTPQERVSKRFWLVLRLNGSVSKVQKDIPKKGSCDL